jgi:hypothetical protein
MSFASFLVAGVVAAVSAPESETAATEKLPQVSALQAGKQCKLSPGMKTRVEGLALAILADQTVEYPESRDEDKWKKMLEGDNVRIVYDKPRPTALTASGGERMLQVSEILVPVSDEKGPDMVVVRYGERYRAYTRHQSKYDAPEMKVLRGIVWTLKRQPGQ